MNLWALKRKIHISWLIASVSVGVSLGIFLAQYINSSEISSASFLVVSIILVFVSLVSRYVYLVPVLIVGSVMFGLYRGTVNWIELEAYDAFYNKSLVIEGSVTDDVDVTASGQLSIRLSRLAVDGQDLPGNIWVSGLGSDIKRGDRLLVSGKLMEGFGNFSGVIYRAGIIKLNTHQSNDIAREARDWFADQVRLHIPEPESSLGIGFLVGQRRNLPSDLELALKTAGLTHIVVASGYNLTILVRLARRLLAKISKYLATLSSAALIVVFIAITGLSPSMTRAGIVTGLGLAAWYYGRRFHPIVLLSLAIMLTLLINPGYAWGDLGWQLSFAAFFGVMVIAPLAQKYLFGDNKPSFIGQILVETVSAQVATMPIIVAAFSQFSSVAIVSNLLVLPLVPIAMLLTFMTGLVGLVLPVVAGVIGLVTTWLLGYMVNVAELFAGLPWAVINLQLDCWGLVISYGIILLICVYLWRVTGYNLRDASLVE